jgi:hypothetical protein
MRPFQHLQVLHHTEARHRQAALQLGKRLAVMLVELVEQLPPRRVGQRFEHLVHAGHHM